MPLNNEEKTSQIAERVKKARKDAGLTQLEVAKAIGVTPQAISNYERGINKIPNRVMLDFAELFNVSVDYLFGISGKWRNEVLPVFENAVNEHLFILSLLNTEGVPNSIKQTIRYMLPDVKTGDAAYKEYISSVKNAALAAYPAFDGESWNLVLIFNHLNEDGKKLVWKYVEALSESGLYENELFIKSQVTKADNDD